MYQYLKLDCNNGIAKITFLREEQLNAMNRVFMDEIVQVLGEINENKAVKVALITGSGRAFMAGADIKEYANQTDQQFLDFQKKGWEIYGQIEHSRIPYLAVVNGFALGGGFEIALACDMIIASENALFGLPEVHLGLVPGGGGTQRLIQKVGVNRVREILYLGGKYTAEILHQWGVVNYVCPDAQLQEFALEIAGKLTRRSPEAIAELKKLVNLSTEPVSLQERLEEEGKSLFELYRTEQAQKKIHEFGNK